VTTKRKKWLLALAGVVLATAGLYFFLREPVEGPIYKGRHLSEWVEFLGGSRQPSPNQMDAYAAIKAAGTNAHPLLVRWLQHESWRRTLNGWLPASLQRSLWADLILLSPADARADGAVQILSTCTNTSLETVKALSQLMNSTSAPRTAGRAAYVLASIGPAGYPSIASALQNPTNELRTIAMAVFYTELHTPNPEIRVLMPGLIACAGGTNRPSSWMAVDVLGRVGGGRPVRNRRLDEGSPSPGQRYPNACSPCPGQIRYKCPPRPAYLDQFLG
jgi:hypothetical protein